MVHEKDGFDPEMSLEVRERVKVPEMEASTNQRCRV
jgi:hypothetical protein